MNTPPNNFPSSNTNEKEDPVLIDVPRGVEGRKHNENYRTRSYFEDPEHIKKMGFNDGAGDNFLGIMGGTTKKVPRDDDPSRFFYKTTGGTPIGYRDDRHRTVIAGSRSGKGRSVIIPELLTFAGSMLVIDPKGENAAVTAHYRKEKLKQEVYILDPFLATPDHCEIYRKQFNPLANLSINSFTVVEDAGLIADAIIVSQGGESAHWDETAKAFIEGLILYVISSPKFTRDQRNLVTVADLAVLKNHASLDDLLLEMIDDENDDSLEGRVSSAAKTLQEKPETERGSVVSNVRKNLKFIDYDAMRSVLENNSFHLEHLKDKPITIYLVLPALRMNTCRQWLRLFVNLLLSAVESNPAKPEFPVQLILDEMAVLGYMKELENAIGQVAGLGLRITSILQDLGQLKAIYKNRYESFLGNSGILQFFGNVDSITSEWISRYLGKTTIIEQGQDNSSIQNKNKGISGITYSRQSVELLTANEVRRYFARDDHFNRQLVCIPCHRPFILQRANYDQHELFKGRFEEWNRVGSGVTP